MPRPKRDMVKFNMMIEKTMLAEIEKFRKTYPNVPSIAEAMRDLLKYALYHKSQEQPRQ